MLGSSVAPRSHSHRDCSGSADVWTPTDRAAAFIEASLADQPQPTRAAALVRHETNMLLLKNSSACSSECVLCVWVPRLLQAVRAMAELCIYAPPAAMAEVGTRWQRAARGKRAGGAGGCTDDEFAAALARRDPLGESMLPLFWICCGYYAFATLRLQLCVRNHSTEILCRDRTARPERPGFVAPAAGLGAGRPCAGGRCARGRIFWRELKVVGKRAMPCRAQCAWKPPRRHHRLCWWPGEFCFWTESLST